MLLPTQALWIAVLSVLGHTLHQEVPPLGSAVSSSSKAIHFLHLSDIHLDLAYTSAAGPSNFCRKEKNTCGNTHTYFNNPWGQIGCDSAHSLLLSSMDYMSHIPTIDFIVITGDLSAHCYETPDVVLHQIDTVVQTIQHRFPNTSLVVGLGNNDLYPHDTLADGPSQFLKNFTTLLANRLPSSQFGKAQQASFSTGGYYSMQVHKGITVLALNSVYWYSNWHNGTLYRSSAAAEEEAQEEAMWVPYNDHQTGESHSTWKERQKLDSQADPGGQLAWLQTALKEAVARKDQVFLTAHVPPGFSRSGAANWVEGAMPALLAVLRQFPSDLFLGFLCGHTHRDEMGVLFAQGWRHDYPDTATDNPALMPLFVSSSYTPRDESNPSFRVYTLDIANQTVTQPISSSQKISESAELKQASTTSTDLEVSQSSSKSNASFVLLDYCHYYFDLYSHRKSTSTPHWGVEYCFRATYGTRSLEASELYGLVESMWKEAQRVDERETNLGVGGIGAFDNYLKYWSVGNPVGAPKDYQCWMCKMTEFIVNRSRACFQSGACEVLPTPRPRHPWEDWKWVTLGVAIATLICLCLLAGICIFLYRERRILKNKQRSLLQNEQISAGPSGPTHSSVGSPGGMYKEEEAGGGGDRGDRGWKVLTVTPGGMVEE